jgi:hypothetical protein
MPDQPLHSPAAAAKLISRPPANEPVNVHTLRRWCALHAAYLSPGANPNANQSGDAPAASRWLTDRDIEVLRTVAQLRADGESTVAINDRLAGMTFAVVVHEDNGADNSSNDNVDNLVIAATLPQNAQDAPESTFLPTVALSSIQSRQDATDARIGARERRLDAQGAEARSRQQFGATMLVLGDAAASRRLCRAWWHRSGW